MTTRRNEKLLWTACIVSVVALALNHLIWTHTWLHSIHGLAPLLLLAAAVSGAVAARLRLHRLAKDEWRDQQSRTNPDRETALFADDAGQIDPLSQRYAHRQYEKWFIPLLAPLLALLLGYWGYRLFAATRWPLDEPVQRLFAASFLIGQAFVCFLLGRLMLGLSRQPADRLLRGPATYLLFAAVAAALTGLAAIVAEVLYPAADRIIRLILSLYAMGIALELLLNTIVFLYRPKKGNTWVTTYESRVTALWTDPGTWSTNVAQTLDYQFGIQVSQSGLQRFVLRILLPLLTAQVLLLYALSSVVVIGPEEEAVIERFGHPYDRHGEPRHLTSGLHLKAPWPIDAVRRYPARRIHTTYIGFEPDPDHPHPPLILWTRPHYPHEEHFIAASKEETQTGGGQGAAVPVNFITINMPIEYRITNLYQYIYHHADPSGVLRMAAYRSVTRELAGRDLIALLGEERQAVGHSVHRELQRRADEWQLGVEILFAGFHGAHPPIPVAEAFESVIGSFEERATAILQARAFENRTLPMAKADGDARRWQAQADKTRRVALAEGETALFQNRLLLHAELPRVYTSRLYLDALEQALRPVRKYVVAASPDLEVLLFNLEEKSRPDLFDFGPGQPEDRFL